MRGNCNECCRHERSRHEHAYREASPGTDLYDINGNRVAEQDESEGECRKSSERRRLEANLDESEPPWTERGTEREEYGDQRNRRSLDRAREERGHYDDEANEGDDRDELIHYSMS